MTIQTLRKKTERYLRGEATPAETRQIQNWLSCTDNNIKKMTEAERSMLEVEILAEIQAFTAYPLFHPQPKNWWHRLKDIF